MLAHWSKGRKQQLPFVLPCLTALRIERSTHTRYLSVLPLSDGPCCCSLFLWTVVLCDTAMSRLYISSMILYTQSRTECMWQRPWGAKLQLFTSWLFTGSFPASGLRKSRNHARKELRCGSKGHKFTWLTFGVFFWYHVTKWLLVILIYTGPVLLSWLPFPASPSYVAEYRSLSLHLTGKVVLGVWLMIKRLLSMYEAQYRTPVACDSRIWDVQPGGSHGQS